MTAATENDAPNDANVNLKSEVKSETTSSEIDKTSSDKTDCKEEMTLEKIETELSKTEPIQTESIKTDPQTESAKLNINTENTKEEHKIEIINTDGIVLDTGISERIIKQLEYYFGDRNLRKDKFMLREIAIDQGWISLDTMLNFKRLAGICSDKAIIAKTVETSNSEIVVLHESKSKIRRNPEKPLPPNTEDEKLSSNMKTVYVKGLPPTLTMDGADDFIAPYGKTSYIKLRRDADGKFKGSMFIEFERQEDCDKFLEIQDLKLSETSEPLLIKSRNEYFKSKNIKQKNEKNEKREAQLGNAANSSETLPVLPLEYEKGRVIKIPALNGKETSREDIKDLFEGNNLDWVTYNKGDSEAFIRFAGEAQPILDKVKVDGKFVLSQMELEPVVLEGEEEEAYYKLAAEQKAEFFNRKKRKQHSDNRGGRGKRQRRY